MQLFFELFLLTVQKYHCPKILTTKMFCKSAELCAVLGSFAIQNTNWGRRQTSSHVHGHQQLTVQGFRDQNCDLSVRILQNEDEVCHCILVIAVSLQKQWDLTSQKG